MSGQSFCVFLIIRKGLFVTLLRQVLKPSLNQGLIRTTAWIQPDGASLTDLNQDGAKPGIEQKKK